MCAYLLLFMQQKHSFEKLWLKRAVRYYFHSTATDVLSDVDIFYKSDAGQKSGQQRVYVDHTGE